MSKEMKRPDWLVEMPSEEYHKATKDGLYLSSHRLAVFRKCPLEYIQRVRGIMVEDEDTEAFKIGTATHKMILEGREAFDAEYMVAEGPVNPKSGQPFGPNTKAYRDWAAAQPKAVIRAADHALMAEMAEAVARHETAAALLAQGFAEGVVRCEYEGEKIQARLDWFQPGGRDGNGGNPVIVDLKTCRDIDRFFYDVRDFGYVHQMAFYAKAVETAGGGAMPNCYLVAVEKSAPFRVGVWRITHGTMTNAIAENRRAIGELQGCRAEDVWPTRFEGMGEL